jgi:hypothetical protein
MGVSERGAARTLNQWLKRTIEKIRFSHPMSCCFRPIFWTISESSTLDELLRYCQHFGIQWILSSKGKINSWCYWKIIVH